MEFTNTSRIPQTWASKGKTFCSMACHENNIFLLERSTGMITMINSRTLELVTTFEVQKNLQGNLLSINIDCKKVFVFSSKRLFVADVNDLLLGYVNFVEIELDDMLDEYYFTGAITIDSEKNYLYMAVGYGGNRSTVIRFGYDDVTNVSFIRLEERFENSVIKSLHLLKGSLAVFTLEGRVFFIDTYTTNILRAQLVWGAGLQEVVYDSRSNSFFYSNGVKQTVMSSLQLSNSIEYVTATRTVCRSPLTYSPMCVSEVDRCVYVFDTTVGEMIRLSYKNNVNLFPPMKIIHNDVVCGADINNRTFLTTSDKLLVTTLSELNDSIVNDDENMPPTQREPSYEALFDEPPVCDIGSVFMSYVVVPAKEEGLVISLPPMDSLSSEPVVSFDRKRRDREETKVPSPSSTSSPIDALFFSWIEEFGGPVKMARIAVVEDAEELRLSLPPPSDDDWTNVTEEAFQALFPPSQEDQLNLVYLIE